MKLVDTLDEQGLLESLARGDQAASPSGLPTSSLPAGDAIPIRRTISVRVAIPPRRHDSGGLLCLEDVLDRHRGNDVPPSAVLRRLASHALWPLDAGDLTVFSVRFRTSTGIELAAPPFAADRARWTHPTDYAPCQVLAETAREADVDVLRYSSARDAGEGSTSPCSRAAPSRRPSRSDGKRGASI